MGQPTEIRRVASTQAASDGSAVDVGQQSHPALGRVRLARRVLRTVVREAALAVPGVAQLAVSSLAWPSALGRPRPRDGVALLLRGDEVAVDVYLVVKSGTSMVSVGEAVQESISAAIEHMLGMRVREVNVYIRDVA